MKRCDSRNRHTVLCSVGISLRACVAALAEQQGDASCIRERHRSLKTYRRRSCFECPVESRTKHSCLRIFARPCFACMLCAPAHHAAVPSSKRQAQVTTANSDLKLTSLKSRCVWCAGFLYLVCLCWFGASAKYELKNAAPALTQNPLVDARSSAARMLHSRQQVVADTAEADSMCRAAQSEACAM